MAQARLGFTQLSSSSVLKALPLSATAPTYKRGCVKDQPQDALGTKTLQPHLGLRHQCFAHAIGWQAPKFSQVSSQIGGVWR